VRFGTIQFQSFSLLLASSNTVPEESEKEPGRRNLGTFTTLRAISVDDPVMTTR
jgi:hypothetical protein